MQSATQSAPDLRDRFVGFAFAAADLLAEIGPDGRILFAAGAYRERFGGEAEQFVGRPLKALIAPEDHAGLEIALSLLAARGRLAPISLRLDTPDRITMALAGLRLPHRSGVSWLTLARIAVLAPEADCGFAAAAAFREAVEARVGGASPGGLGLVEVGGWQQLPQTARHGLEASIAAAMREAGGAGSMAAEMATGRFGVLSPSALDMTDVQQRIGRILAASGAGRPVTSTAIPLGTGGAAVPEAMRALRFALTCFTAKGTAAVREAGFGAGLRTFLERAEDRASGMRIAIENGRFRMVFQPVVSLADRKMHHFEALLRPFPLAGHERDSTQEFVSFAEAMGMAELLDQAVLRRVVQVLPGTSARVAVNVSGISMQSSRFREELMGCLDNDPRLAKQLMVELTETADIDDVPAVADMVNRLASAGVPVCLDDFGAGFAAFRYLREFRVHFVKIDGSYVHRATTGARDSGFVGAMVELARCAGAGSIAEMVETEHHATTMQSLGVQFGQGWLFGRPGALPGTL